MNSFLKLILKPWEAFTFYGGGSGGGSSGNQTSTTQVVYSPEEQAMRSRLFNLGEQAFQRSSAAAARGYPGPAPTAFSPETQQAQQQLLNFAGGQGQQIGNAATGALQFGLGDVLYPDSNPALKATADTAIRRVGEAYTDPGGVLSNIRSNFTAGNTAGSNTRESIAGGLAGRSYLNTIGDVTGDIYSKGYGQGLDFMKSSMAFAPNLYNLATQPALTTAAVGAQKEGMAAAQENFAAAQRGFDITSPWAVLQPYTQMMTGMQNPATQSTMSGGQSSGMMQPLGMALMGAQMGSMIPGIGTGMGAAAGFMLGLL